LPPGAREPGPTPTGWHRRGLDIPPEITGHWQVPGSSSHISLVEMVELDYLYVANWCVWGDVQLLPRTIPFVLRGNGI
jgi:lipopolysaccharide/colanic/teichoic acid biosynthesis glycosyltransferase